MLWCSRRDQTPKPRAERWRAEVAGPEPALARSGSDPWAAEAPGRAAAEETGGRRGPERTADPPENQSPDTAAPSHLRDTHRSLARADDGRTG